MEPIKVKPYPPARAFPSVEAAVRHAMFHPRLSHARRDAALLEGAHFVDACWTPFEWIVRFDHGLSLCVRIEDAEVRWAIRPSEVPCAEGEFQRVGSAPVVLDWTTTIGLWRMDCSALVAKRRGARFKDLFVNDHGLFLYLHDRLILQFGQAERLEDGRRILYVAEDD